jgi:hypothetical protein
MVRAYPGFFEVNADLHTMSFWFRQPHKRAVKTAVRGRSCTACTSARIGTLPADPLAEYVKLVKAGTLPPPLGPAEAITLALAAAGAVVEKQIAWQDFDFDHPDKGVTLPPAGDAPVAGVFQMIYRVTAPGVKKLDAYLGAEFDGGAGGTVQAFSVNSLGMPPFRLVPVDGKLAVGDVPEGAAPRQLEVVCWSATRATMPPPAAAVSPRDPFVRLGTPVPVPPAGLAVIAQSLEQAGEQGKVKPPVRSAYRVPVTIHRTKPADAPANTPPEPDVGPFERTLAFTIPGEQQAQTLALTGTVTGLVALTDGRTIDLQSFPGATGLPEKAYQLVSDRPGLKLAVATADCRPKYVTVKLGDPEDRGGRRFWPLKLSVAPGVALEEFPATSAVVLTADTGDGVARKVKIPLKGRAYTRGGR